MTDIVDNSSFDTVPLIEEGDAVKGGINGPANKQAKALANRTKFLNDKIGKLGPTDVGAEPKGEAANQISQHESDPNAHPQYLKSADGDTRYLQVQGANLPNGAVLLDSRGKIPTMYLDLIQSSYVAVADQTARLALPKTANLTIAAQVDIDTLFYLNGNLDPSVSTNWVKGQSATVSGVSRVFNRTGDITAQSGDYNADQITETASRTFVAAADRANWSGKQDKLTSGTSIKTVGSKSLLGGGDLGLTPADIGAAAKVHKHDIADVNNLSDELAAAASKGLVAGKGVSLTTDPNTKKVTLDLLGGSGGGSFPGLIVADRQNSVANQIHNFNFQENNSYSFIAYALKEIAGSTNQTNPLELFPAGSAGLYDQSPGLVFNGGLKPYIGETLITAKEGSFYSARLTLPGKDFKIDQTAGTALPYLVANNTENGMTASASSIYSAGYDVWRVFNGKTGSGNYWCSGSGTGSPSDTNPQWVQLAPPSSWASVVKSYTLTSLASDGSGPVTWKFQGRNDDNTWTDLDTQTNYAVSRSAPMTFNVNATKAYKAYRLYITKSDATGNWMRIDELQMTFAVDKCLFLRDKNGVFYTLDGNNALQTIAAGSVVNGAGFAALPTTLNSAVQNLLPLDVISIKADPVKTTVTPVNTFFKTKVPYNVANTQRINKFIFGSTVQTGGEIYLALTRNGTDYLTFNGTAWVALTLTGNMSTDMTTLINSGMTRTAVNALTTAQIALLYPDKMDGLGFAGVIVNGTAAGAASSLDYVSLNADLRSTWKLQTPAEVEISRVIGSMSFKTIAAGNYKLAYQFL